jgi:hypothetical protein
MPLSLWMFVAILDFIGIGGCGKWPPVAESKSQIARLDVTTASVRVRGLPDADIPALARLRELKDLDFAGGMAVEDAAITDDGIEALAKLALPKLDSLDLGYNTKITNAGLVHVAKIETLSMLLLPACPNITGAGLEHLIGMKRLVYLDLRGCQGITDDALQTLASKPDLEQLQLGGCRKVTERGVAQLQVSLPNLRIVKDDKQWNDYDRQYEK